MIDIHANKSLRSIISLATNQVKYLLKQTFPQTGFFDFKLVPLYSDPACDYNSAACKAIFNKNKDKKSGKSLGCSSDQELGTKLIETFKLQNDPVFQSILLTNDGFLKFYLQDQLVENEINQLLTRGIHHPQENSIKIAVDFSSPNIAKEMHVGHLRSTIIGESICRIFEYQGHHVHRINHVGDWGTSFGMLIHYLKITYPDFLQNQPDISDLTSFYKKAKILFDEDKEFKEKAQQEVVRLQGGDELSLKVWRFICEVSRQEFMRIYKRLNIKVEEYGESFYNNMLADVVKELEDKKLIVLDDGAKCIFMENKKIKQPIIAVKKDGGYNYDSTDLAAIKYRIQNLGCNRLVYITDSGQKQHFDMIFEAAKRAGWLTNGTVAEHMGFGVVQDANGQRFRSKSGDSVKLELLLDEGKRRALETYQTRSQTDQQNQKEEAEEIEGVIVDPSNFESSAEKLAMAAIKYFDLKQNRISDYRFDYDKMLDTKGNTAIYLLYSYARLCQIIKKCGLSQQELLELCASGSFKITHPHERYLASNLIKFTDVIESVTVDLQINKLTDYIYDISCLVAEGYKKYRIVGNEHTKTRILLIEATRQVLEKALFLVGIEALDKI